MDALGPAGGFTIDDLRQNLTLRYIATLPGDIKDTNGERVDDSTVRWDLPPSGAANLTAESKVAAKGSTAWFILAAIGSFIAVALLAGLVGGILLRRRRAGGGRLPLPDSASAARGTRRSGSDGDPTTMSDVGTTLARVVERVVSGDSVNKLGAMLATRPLTIAATSRRIGEAAWHTHPKKSTVCWSSARPNWRGSVARQGVAQPS